MEATTHKDEFLMWRLESVRVKERFFIIMINIKNKREITRRCQSQRSIPRNMDVTSNHNIE